MPRRLIGALLALLAFAAMAACTGDDDDAAPASTTRAPESTTTTVAPSLTEREGVNSFPAARTIELRDATLALGEAIGFAFHPNGTVTRVRASSPDVELCPATTDGAIDLTGGSWPAGMFATCHTLDQGVPSPGTAYHVGWVLRSTATADITIDATIDYDATDGFFLWVPPSQCGTLTIHPESSDAVGVSGAATVTQSGDPVAMHFDENYGHELSAGRVVPGEAVDVTCAADRAANTAFIVDWS